MPTVGVIKSGIDSLLEFVYPSCCLNCNEYIEQSGELICPDCWDKITSFDSIYCANCSNDIPTGLKCPVCGIKDSLPFIALGHFGNPLGEIIRQYKYHSFTKLGAILAERVLEKHNKLINNISADLIVPIPLHSYRLKSRGFNQAEILADNISKRTGIEVNNSSLQKIRNTKDQKLLDHNKRIENIKDAYKVFGNELSGKKIILVDDVITTGATLRETRKEILKAEGKVVFAIVIATAGFID